MKIYILDDNGRVLFEFARYDDGYNLQSVVRPSWFVLIDTIKLVKEALVFLNYQKRNLE
jgi:hypothetical protein